jgi:hypothetical protein
MPPVRSSRILPVHSRTWLRWQILILVRPVSVCRCDDMCVIELPAGSWWDWDMLHFDGSQLRLAAGDDLAYHHGLELVFIDVAYIACPTQFQDPRFRHPTAEERAAVRRHVGEDAPLLVAFDIEAADGYGDVACLVAAGSVEVVPGLVYRYWRDNLAPDERLAPHVRPAPP